MELEDFAGLRYSAPTRIVPYSFSSGCPWKRCSFCPEKAEDMPYRGIRSTEAIAQIARLGEKYSPGLYHFTDNEISPLYLRALADSAPGAPWYGFARFSRILLDPGFCRTLAASGCVMLQLGLESGDQGVLDRLGKGTRLEEIDAILDNLAAASIGTYIYLLFGTPAEDRDAAMRTRDFIARRAGCMDFLNVAIFNLPASSEEARSLDTNDFYEGELSLYSQFRHPSGWDRSAVRAFLREEFEAIPEIKGILARTPPVFTSSHAPFFLARASANDLCGSMTLLGYLPEAAKRGKGGDSGAEAREASLRGVSVIVALGKVIAGDDGTRSDSADFPAIFQEIQHRALQRLGRLGLSGKQEIPQGVGDEGS
jgi:hypothetical protein